MPKQSTSKKSALHRTLSDSMLQTPISRPPENEVEVIGCNRVRVASNDDIQSVAETTLINTLTSADYGEAGGKTTYGNPLGRELLEERQDLMKRVKGLEDNKAKMDTLITDLQNRVQALSLASAGYRKIRNRFIDVYRRDVRHDLDNQGRDNIAGVNEAAHHADAVADASLYTSRERTDETVLFEIYGLSAIQISSLAEAGALDSIATLNAGATWRANRSTTNIPPDVAATFSTFVGELGVNLGKSPTDGTTPLSRAYYAFWTAHREGLRRLRQRVA